MLHFSCRANTGSLNHGSRVPQNTRSCVFWITTGLRHDYPSISHVHYVQNAQALVVTVFYDRALSCTQDCSHMGRLHTPGWDHPECSPNRNLKIISTLFSSCWKEHEVFRDCHGILASRRSVGAASSIIYEMKRGDF